MTRGLALIVVAIGCAHPAEPVDPCPGLRARYEAVRTQRPCTTNDECVAVVTIHDEIEMGRSADEPCTPATHRDSQYAVTMAARAFQEAGCGDVVPVHATCRHYGHGQHLLCVDHACQAQY